ncbi:MAG: hypothetical protein H0T89_09300 [Deltaproteobacteria bacterium]|nr:hypothetical protein [Deltaproteobacteria bacterium]MDQ3295938.1 hypothetical protein [Myxococcota bacterium]
MKTVWLVAGMLAWTATAARAGVLADALAKPDAATVAKLRSQRDDLAARCTLGAVYAKRGDLSRAHLYLEGCADAELPEDIAGDIAKVTRDVKKRLRDGDLSPIEIVTKPDGLVVEISALPGETFTTPATVWVQAGTYEVKAVTTTQIFTSPVTTGVRSRAMVVIETEPKQKITAPKAGTADFSDETAAEPQQSGPPPAVKRPSLVPDKYNKKTASTAGFLEDPLATRATVDGPLRGYWLGVRLGAGMFDDGAADSRVGAAVAATARFAIGERTFVAARLDYSRRGGDGPDALDTAGASGGLGVTLGDSSIALAAIAQLRADLRFAESRAMQPVSRAGASAAIGLELALPSTPITAGLRFEQGLTELVPGSRDRALLLELGVDWR